MLYYQAFNITKWNYWNKGKYQKGRGFSLGLNIGCAYFITKKWSIDIYIGGGWQNSQYKGYDTKTHELAANGMEVESGYPID